MIENEILYFLVDIKEDCYTRLLHNLELFVIFFPNMGYQCNRNEKFQLKITEKLCEDGCGKSKRRF